MAVPGPPVAGTVLALASSASAAVAVPSGVAVNDIIVVHLYLEASRTVTVPGDFAPLDGNPNATAQQWEYVYWKRATAADSGTYSFSWPGSTTRTGRAYRIPGVVVSGTPFETPSRAARSSNGTVTPAVSTTTTGPDRLLLWLATNFQAGTWTPPSGLTEITDSGEITAAYGTQATAGATGPITGTGSNSGQQTVTLLAFIPTVRFYATAATHSTLASVSGQSSGWTTPTTNFSYAFWTKAGSSTATSSTDTSSTNPNVRMVRRWASPALTRAGTTNGALRAVLAVLESDDAMNATTRIAVSVHNADGTVRASLGSATFGAEWPTVLTAREHILNGLNAVAVVPGEYVSFEVGYSAANSVATSYVGTVQRGGTDATDLAAGDTDTAATSRSGWFEFDSAAMVELWRPVVDAGADATGAAGTPFSRIATETATGVTARSWTVISGPSSVGASVATISVTLSDPQPGVYVLRYSATNPAGTDTDDFALTVPAITVHEASVSFAGAGALTAAGQAARLAGATFAGAGQMSAAAGVARTATTAFAGSGSLTATATRVAPAAATFAGAGSMLATPGVLAAATFAGAGQMLAAPQQTHQAAASFAGAGQLSAGAQSTQRIATAFAGAGQMLVGGTRARPAATAFAGAGQMLVDGRRRQPALVSFAGAGALSTTGVRTRPAGTAFAGAGRMQVSARIDKPGLNVSLWAVTSSGVLAPLPAFQQLELSRERNGVGAVSVDYPASAPRFTLLRAAVDQDRPVEVEVWLGGSRDGRLRALLTQTSGDELDKSAVWRFSGTFLEQILSDGILYTQPAPAENGELRFGAVNAGQVVLTVLQQVQARGVLTGITRDWTTTTDSSGQAWPSTFSGLKYSPKTDLLAILQDLVDQDLAEFELTADRVLRLWAPDRRGVNRTTGSDPTLFRWGRVSSAPVRHTTRDTVTAVLAIGADGLSATASDATAEARLGRRIEVGIDAGNISDQGALTAFAQVSLSALVKGQEEIRHPLTFGPGDPRPGAGYDLADRVLSERAGGVRRGVDVQQWTLTASRQRVTGGEVVLNDLIASRLQRLQRQLDRIRSGVVVAGTSQSPTTEDTIPPSAPTGVVATSTAYQDSGDTYASVQVGWTPVTTNASGPQAPKARAAQLIADRMASGLPVAEDWTWPGSPAVVSAWNDVLLTEYEASGQSNAQAWLAALAAAASVTGAGADDVAGYRVEWRTTAAGSSGGWQLGRDVSGGGTASTSFGGVAAGITISIRVAAYDTNGNQSDWSTVVQIVTETDATAPPTPSTPSISNYLGVLMVEWNGLGSAGETMPLDFDYVEIHMSAAAVFTPTAATYVDRLYGAGQFPIADLPYGVSQYFRLVALDRTAGAPNRSAPSAAAGGAPEKVVADDVFAGAIGSAALANLAVITAKVDNLAVNDAKFGSGSVGKLTTGVFSAALTLSGIFRTGTTGARGEWDSTSFRQFNGSGVQTLGFVPGGVSFMTGEFRTALSGQRIVFNPSGTIPDEIRIFPAGGSDYARINARTAPGDGTAAIIIDGAATSGSVGRGRLAVYRSEAALGWVIGDTGGDIENGYSRTALSCNANSILAWTQGIIEFSKYSGSSKIAMSNLYMIWKSGSSGSHCPVLTANVVNAGIKFDAGYVCAVINEGTLFGAIKATEFVVTSTQEAKTDITDIRRVLDPLLVGRLAPAKAYRYTDEVIEQGDDAPIRFGPVAEDLPDELVRMTPRADGQGSEKSVDLMSILGLVYAMVNQQQDQEVRSVQGRSALTSGQLRPGTLRQVAVTWDNAPLELPTDVVATAIPAMPTAAGKIRARVIPSSVTTAGCTVELAAASGLIPVTITATLPVSVEVTGRYNYLPPLETAA